MCKIQKINVKYICKLHVLFTINHAPLVVRHCQTNMTHAPHSPRTAALYCEEEMPGSPVTVDLYCNEEMPNSFVILHRGKVTFFRNPAQVKPPITEAPSVVTKIYSLALQAPTPEPEQRFLWDAFSGLNDTSEDFAIPCSLSSGMDLDELDITGLGQEDLISALGRPGSPPY